jgi:preprotein translocase subunit SecF
MVALLLFGGPSISHFVLILLIGLLSGTYSSIFNAAQLLVFWEYREWERWFGKKSEGEPAAA